MYFYGVQLKTVHIVFGEMGAGKNFQGERLAKRLKLPFFDGDDVVPPEMAERVHRFGFLPADMVSAFVAGPLFDAIVKRSSDKGIVVAQALYRDKDRRALRGMLYAAGFDVCFALVRAPFVRNAAQIASRPKGFRWFCYWLGSKPFFERPTHDYTVMERK